MANARAPDIFWTQLPLNPFRSLQSLFLHIKPNLLPGSQTPSISLSDQIPSLSQVCRPAKLSQPKSPSLLSQVCRPAKLSKPKSPSLAAVFKLQSPVSFFGLEKNGNGKKQQLFLRFSYLVEIDLFDFNTFFFFNFNNRSV